MRLVPAARRRGGCYGGIPEGLHQAAAEKRGGREGGGGGQVLG